jgi:hypothetical protein
MRQERERLRRGLCECVGIPAFIGGVTLLILLLGLILGAGA